MKKKKKTRLTRSLKNLKEKFRGIFKHKKRHFLEETHWDLYEKILVALMQNKKVNGMT